MAANQHITHTSTPAAVQLFTGKEVREFTRGIFLTRDGEVYSARSGRIALLKLNRTTSGYLTFGIWSNGKPSTIRLHKAMAEVWIGPKPSPKHVARHLNDIRTENHIDNIAWGTYADNSADAKRNGSHILGSTVGTAKLTEDSVMAIRLSMETDVALAKKFGVSRGTIYEARRGIQWSQIDVVAVKPPIQRRRTGAQHV